MNNELEGLHKEAVVALRFCPSICLKGLRKATKRLRIAGLRTEI
jgi:hypothetical protein